jgi:hypothetical protein
MARPSEAPGKCKSCGVPLDEIPFEKCAEHLAYSATLEESFEDELDAAYYEAIQDAWENR